MPRAPRIVCFDLGGVVVRICRSFEEAVLASGVPLRRSVDLRDRIASAAPLVDAHQMGRISARDFHGGMSELFEGLYSVPELARIHEAVTREEYEGIEALIVALNRHGLVTACLSNTNATHWELLLRQGAIQALQHRFASHLLGLMKPDAAIYRSVERELKARPEEILFFDDLIENVDAAIALGWDAVVIDHEGDTARQIEGALSARGVRLDLSRA